MKYAVLVAAMSLSVGTAIAAAPVEDIASSYSGDRISKLERIIKAKQQNEFDMQRRLDSLQNEVLELRGITERQNYEMNQMLQRQRQLFEEVANLTAKSSAQPAPSMAATPSSSSSTSVSSSSTPSAPASSSLGETASYEAAVNLVLKERRYDDAIPAFRNFIAQYSNSGYAANANYWLGQLLFNKGELNEAKSAFSAVVSKYSDSSKRGDSLVKLGMIAERENDSAGARALYNKVLKEYGNSAAARLAQQQLSSLQG